ncbi:uncharacterized protein BDR25DRAFT_339902 [Lindgomyces ingoldianus]|uniref:Uncharacterized protein n=1 Tax=Lindgomyces ingoldianus TaxID=673940 RepID=A0ACB6RA00_9PLEO|nr:uncharacterized protein BDR25DRAFT_339902 [Lindgomyces ingoldianus]KAF2476011.1 hypothetical protein BDR25DRAFT_339902 [Lindgomyces ingoldianus]
MARTIHHRPHWLSDQPANYPGKATKSFNRQCDDSDGVNFCDCQQREGPTERCMYHGRHVEPLAFALKDMPTMPQEECPLFSKLPTEVRQMVYDYALTDCTSHPLDGDNPYRQDLFYNSQKITIRRPDIAVNLLQTCRAIYLEAYRLPLLLNPFIVYNWGSQPSSDVTRPSFYRLAPWQFALIHRLDISLQQIALEGDQLGKYLMAWKPNDRHEGAVVAPRFYQETRSMHTGVVTHSFNFGILKHYGPPEDGVEVTLPNKNYFYPNIHPEQPTCSTARSMLARPITHLTLRLAPTDWWTWSSSPASATSRFGLDPTIGDGGSLDHQRPTPARMLRNAEERRAGRWPVQSVSKEGSSSGASSWGARVAKLSDLKMLELVLQTFEDKKDQLDLVTDCAKTWTFPLDNSRHQLVWDGKAEKMSFEGEDGALGGIYVNGHGYRGQAGKKPKFVVSVIRFKRVIDQ